MSEASSIPLPVIGTTPNSASEGGAGRKPNRLRRIREMRFAEIAYRGLQEASKWLERVAPSGPYAHPEALLHEQCPSLANPDAAIRMLRGALPQRFFPGATDAQALSQFPIRLPDEARGIVEAANTLASGRFDLLGYRQLWFGDPIDWHLDPVADRRSPIVHWSRIDPLDTDSVGDSKVVWELNRHQWLIRLAQAYVLTGDARYANACVSAIDAWLEANPAGVGVNWASSLEVALRLISWCWTLALLRESPAVSGEWTMKALAAIWMHATHVRRYLSYYFSPNTHLTGEALGLFYAGTLFPEFHDAGRWRDLGARILMSESHAQIHADGVQFEQSTCYHRYTAETYLHFLLLASRNHLPVTGHLADRIARMVDFLVAVRLPDGTIPSIGDGDGGYLLPLARRSPADAQGVFALATAMYGRPDFAWASGAIAPEIFWLLGDEGVRRFDEVRPAEPPRSASRVFPSGGYAILRSGWTGEAHQVIVDVGPLGCLISGGHGHADLLSVQCAVFGEPCIVDGGTYCYTADAQWRTFFRSSAAHSTVLVDGRGQSEPAGPFGWIRRPRVRLREWHSSDEFDFLDADHDAYAGLADPVTHRRRVVFVKPSYWIVVDDLAGATRHQVDLTFQFAPIEVTLGPHAWARARTPRGRVLWVSPFPSAPIHASITSGEVAPIRGWISRDYGQRQPAPMLVYSSSVSLPWRILTLLLPDAHGASQPPAVQPIYDARGLPTGLTFERSRRSVRFDEHSVEVRRK